MSTQIMVDQFGYRSTMGKRVVVFADPVSGQNSASTYTGPGAYFTVRRVSDNSRAYSNVTTPWGGGVTHSQSQDKCWWGDFTAFSTPGDYYIQDANAKRSFSFHLGDDVYNDALEAAGRMFFYQRCGTNLPSANGGAWFHAACHTNSKQDRTAKFYTNNTVVNKPKNVAGGWHDAGDFAKYLGFQANTMWNMLAAYEMNPGRFADNWNIPESGNGVSDILDEIACQLKWIQRMQRADGGVCTRVIDLNQTYTFAFNNDPSVFTNTRVYTVPTTWASAIAAAVLAQAARIYQGVNPALAQSYLITATNAWSWVRSHPTMFPANGSDGACSVWGPACTNNANMDRRCRVYAAAELWRATGRSEFYGFFTNNFDNTNTRDNGFHPLEAGRFDPNAAIELNNAYIDYYRAPGADPVIKGKIKTALDGMITMILAATNNDPYRAYMWDGHYTWGSSFFKAQWGNLLLLDAWIETDALKAAKYRQLAGEYLSYFHGRNPLNWTYLTTMEGAQYPAEKCVSEIWSYWFANGTTYDGRTSPTKTPPGYLPGGANQFYGGTRIPPKNEPIMKSYWDWNNGSPEDSWSVTEPQLKYQAAYLFLVSAFAGSPGTSLSNFICSPNPVTNGKAQVLAFSVTIATQVGYNITSVTLNLVPMSGPRVAMSNKGNGLWRYSWTMPANQTSSEYYVDMIAWNSQKISASLTAKVAVYPQAYLPVLIIYDGETVPTDVNVGWSGNGASLVDVSSNPRFGTQCSRLIFTNAGGGYMMQLREPTYTGLDASLADTLEMWVHGYVDQNSYIRAQLLDKATRASAYVDIPSRTGFWKVIWPVSFLTNQGNGANQGFDMKTIIGMQFVDNGIPAKLFLDNIWLSAKMAILSSAVNPSAVDNTAASNVRFTVTAKSAMTNITSVTLDLSPLGGNRVAMTNLSQMTSFRYTYKVAAGTTPSCYQIPVLARDGKGNWMTASIPFCVLGPTPKIVKIVYDGETTPTDAVDYQNWYSSTFVDIPGGNGTRWGRFIATNGGANGVQVGDSIWWNGVDVTMADRFQFYYQSPIDLTVKLFSMDSVNPIMFSKPISLTASAGMKLVATNLSSITQAMFTLKKVVGAQIISVSLPGTAYFDDMVFTTMVEIRTTWSSPSLISNTKNNSVQFWAKIFSGNTTIWTAYLDASSVGGPAKVRMTNISGATLWRYTMTVLTNRPEGNFRLPVWAYDDRHFRGSGSIPLTIWGRPLYDELIVYDGDTIKADFQQWFPTNRPPFSGAFYEVDGFTAPPHSGTYSGLFTITNNNTTFFQIRDWGGINVTQAAFLDIYAAGAVGGEQISLTFRFGPSDSRTTNLTLSAGWNKWRLSLSQLTNGRGMGTNVKYFVGMAMNMTTRGQTVYLDDIKFVKYLTVMNGLVDPNFVLSTVKTPVTVTASAYSAYNNITAVTLNLTSIGGGRVLMTNLAGMTSFRYSFTTSSNTNLSGLYSFKITAVDANKNSYYTYVYLLFFVPGKTMLYDFESGDTVWGPIGTVTFPSSEGWFAEQSTNFKPAPTPPVNDTPYTTFMADRLSGQVYHKDWGLGWTPIWTHGGEAAPTGDLNADNETWIANNLNTPTMPYPGWYTFVYWKSGKNWAQDDLWAHLGQLSGSWLEGNGPDQTVRFGGWTKLQMNFNRTWGAYTSITAPVGTYRRIFVEWDGGYSAQMKTNSGSQLYLDYINGYDPMPPKKVPTLTAMDAATGDKVILNWGQTGDSDIYKYLIFQNTVNNFGTASIVACAYSNYYEDRGVKTGTTYYYWVVAEDGSENRGTASDSALVTPTGRTPTVVYPFKGASLLANPGEVSTAILTILTNIQRTGANTVSVPVTWSMASSVATTITSNAALTLSDQDLRYLITNTHRMGMKVFLVPKISVTGGQISDILPANYATWFGPGAGSYRNFIVKYATLAAATKVELFSIGYELNSVATDSFNALWDAQVVAPVNAVYFSNTTFCALPNSQKGFRTLGTLHQTYRDICVWDNVDYIGLDLTYPLNRYTASPSLSRLYWDWDDYIVTNDAALGNNLASVNILDYNWINNFEDWRFHWGITKPVLLTEIKYPSRDFAAQNPRFSVSGAMNTNLQADCYEAVFRRFNEKSWTAGTFFGDWRLTAPVTTNYSPQGKPAYNVVKEWYTIRPEHFAVLHPGGGEALKWVPVQIVPHLADHTPVTGYIGTITLDIDRGTSASITWSNMGSCGALVDWGAGSAKATFTYSAGCNGIASLAIKDNSAETVNFHVKAPVYLREDLSEDPNLILSGPLSHFVVQHDGYAVKNTPEQITISAIDAFGSVKADYVGVVSLFVRNSTGSVVWTAVTTNGTFGQANNRAWFTFRGSEDGVMVVALRDNTAETIDVEAQNQVGTFQDNDVNDPLRVMQFSSFAIVHDGAALLGYSEDVMIRADDGAGNAVYGITGLVTIFISPGTPPNGAYSLVLNSGNGTLTQVAANRWTYNLLIADNGFATFQITGTVADTINIQATDGVNSDLDFTVPVNMVWQTHLYHYVKSTSATPTSPYTSPLTAATAITDALKAASPGDTVLILDNAVYPPLYIDASFATGRVIAGAPTNRPTIRGTGATHAVQIGGGTGTRNIGGFGLKNLNLVAGTGHCFYMLINATVLYNGFRIENCYMTNNSPGANFMLLDSGGDTDDPGATLYFLCNTMTGVNNGIKFGEAGMNWIWTGNTFRNSVEIYNFLDTGSWVPYYGNIFDGVTITGSGNDPMGNDAGTTHDPFIGDLFYANACSGLVLSATHFGATNCVSVNNTGYGFNVGSALHDYNLANGNVAGQFSAGQTANESTAAPLFVNAAAKDFRPAYNSPLIRSGRPNGTILPNKGPYSWNAAPAQPAASAVTSYTLMFLPFSSIPVGGQVELQLPASGSVALVSGASSSMGTMSVSVVDDDTLLLTRTSGGVIPAGVAQRVIVTGVRNPSVVSTTHSVRCATRVGNPGKLDGDYLDYPRMSSCFQIVASSLNLTNYRPVNRSANMPLTTSITCRFDGSVDTSTVKSNSVRLYDSGWVQTAVTYSYPTTDRVVITPSAALQANEFYTVSLTTNLRSSMGGNLTKNTQFHFYTTTGTKTAHEFNTIALNGALPEWNSANITGLGVSELSRDDGASDSVWGHTKQLWVTWNTNALFIALRKPALSGLEWYDYVYIDTNRDDRGPASGPAGWHPVNFADNRRPEFVLMLDHNNLGPVWDAWTNYRWTGAAWQANAIVATNHGQDSGQTIELRIPWGTFGSRVPNRISVAASVFTNRNMVLMPAYDWCPETVNGPTNWITVDPDNDGNDVPDGTAGVHHFLVSHDGTGVVNIWENFQVQVISSSGSVYSNYTGLVTIALSLGTGPNVRFTNMTGSGTFTFLGNGRATYQWGAGDFGNAQFRVTDSSAEDINIRIAGPFGKADDLTDLNLTFTPGEPPMGISKAAVAPTPGTVMVGDTITYRIEVTNKGSQYSYSVKIQDAIPYGTIYVTNSLREGAKSSTYATASTLSDSGGNDFGYCDGATVTFCGPGSGIAPATSGSLAGGAVWCAYFQVRVKGTNQVMQAKLVVVTNTNRTFDGYCVNNATFVSNALIAAGDYGVVLPAMDLSQLSNNRDHYFSFDPDNIGYQGYNDGVTFQVGNANIGGAGGEDNYHSFLTFGLSSIPANGTITAATLFIRQSAAAGAGLENPIHVDHVDYQNTYGNAPLDASRFNCTAPRSVLASDYFSFNGLAAIGWVRIPSTAQVQYADTNPKSFTENGDNRVFQVRLRDNSEAMGAVNALATFSAQNDATPANRPYLRVYYKVGGKEVRGFMGFDLSAMSNDNVTSATLYVYQTNVLGTGAIVSPILLDNVDYGNTFDVNDFGAPVIQGSVASFGVAAPGWIGIPVRAAVSNAWTNKKAWTKNLSQRWLQLRFRPSAMDTNNDASDQQILGSSETTIRKPYLRVYHLMPRVSGAPAAITNRVTLGTNIFLMSVPIAGASNTSIVARKYLTNVTLKGAASAPVPGATLSYKLVCSNKTAVAAKSAVVYDKIQPELMFVTNSATAGAGPWTIEYSTNATASQIYSSPDYTAIQPTPTRVRWIRWKKASMAASSNDSFRYRVTVR